MEQSSLENEEDDGFVVIANELLEKCGIKKCVSNITECNDEFFVSIFVGLLGDDLKGLIRNPVLKADRINNCQCVIDAVGHDILSVDLSHISAERVVNGNRNNIRNLLEIFAGLLEYFLEFADDRDDSDMEDSEEDDSNLLATDHDIVSGVLREELGTNYSDVYPTQPWRKEKHVPHPEASTKPPLPPRSFARENDREKVSVRDRISMTGSGMSGLRNSGHDADVSKVSDSTNELIKLGESSLSGSPFRAAVPHHRVMSLRGQDHTLPRNESHSTSIGDELTQYTLTTEEARGDSVVVQPNNQALVPQPLKSSSNSMLSSTLSSSYQQQISPLDPEKDGATLETLGVRPRVGPTQPSADVDSGSEGGGSGRSTPVFHHHYHHHYHHPVRSTTTTTTSAGEPTIPRPSVAYPERRKEESSNYLQTIPGIASLANQRPQPGTLGTRSSILDRPGISGHTGANDRPQYSFSSNLPSHGYGIGTTSGIIDTKTTSSISSNIPGSAPQRTAPYMAPRETTAGLPGNGTNIPGRPYTSTTYSSLANTEKKGNLTDKLESLYQYGTRSGTVRDVQTLPYSSSYSGPTIAERDVPGIQARSGISGTGGVGPVARSLGDTPSDRLSSTAPLLTSWRSGARGVDNSKETAKVRAGFSAGPGVHSTSSTILSDSVFSTIPTSLRSREVSAPPSSRTHKEPLPTTSKISSRDKPASHLPPPVQREEAASELLSRYRGTAAQRDSDEESEGGEGEGEEGSSDVEQHSDSEVDYRHTSANLADDSTSSEASVRRSIHERWKKLHLPPEPTEKAAKSARRAVTFNEDIQTIPITSRMDRLRRLLDEEEEEQRQRHTAAMRATYHEQLKSLQKQQGKEKREHTKRKVQGSPLVPKKKAKRQHPKKKPSSRLEAIYGPKGRKPRARKRTPLRDRKRSASASPVVGRRTKMDEPHALLPDLYDDFPFLHVSPQTTHAMWKKQARHLSQLTKTGSDVKKTKTQRQVEEAEVRQERLLKILKKELDFNQRLRDQREREESQRSVKAKVNDKRHVAARARRYYDDYQLRMRAKMLKRRTREEMIFKNLFEEGLDIQKSRVRELRQYAREKREALAQRQQNEIDSLENYYRDQFSMLSDEMARERYEVKVRQQAQEKVIHQMRRELRQKMEKEVQEFQENLTRDDDSAYFRQLEADRLRREFQLALYKTNI